MGPSFWQAYFRELKLPFAADLKKAGYIKKKYVFLIFTEKRLDILFGGILNEMSSLIFCVNTTTTTNNNNKRKKNYH